ncbi:hypothetical protein PV396_44340 [Streptomyces sp. ME02-8801-2C]|uniref:hypothetical protein n=1 Tax=Streptomyces sp. ME02-8801-2C TaxID=3028680 RepID=UPI0029A2ECF9|nr:hypothetical protein [Streptomyces sp. ME02-8801-2C]MDX3458876.1 hypothetical protein [Streptomyces sp. ME02-8801-2C]
MTSSISTTVSSITSFSTLRRRTGCPVDKFEILRSLIRLVDVDDQVAEHLARALDRRTTS